MADYLVSGKKGAGKSLFCVGVIRDAIRDGKRVATNLDIHLDKLLGPQCKAHIIRLPDRPTEADMLALGRGQDVVVEDDNGILVLDECSAFFNSRTWGDKERQPLLDWFIHSRKYGWDTYFIAQGAEQLDKQLRATQIEYHISVKRTDKWPIPFITPLGKALGFNIRFPKFHIGIVRHGMERDALLIERRWYRGADLFPAYDTQQVFIDRGHPQAVGMHSVLSPFHTKGRYMGWFAMHKAVLYGGMLAGLVLGAPAGAYAGYLVWGKPRVEVAHKVELSPLKVKGYVIDGPVMRIQLSDGRFLIASDYFAKGTERRFKAGDVWYAVE